MQITNTLAVRFQRNGGERPTYGLKLEFITTNGEKLVHFINNKQTQKGREIVEAAEPSDVSQRQCWPLLIDPAASICLSVWDGPVLSRMNLG